MKRVLVTGAGGQVGSRFVEKAALRSDELVVIPLTRSELDIADSESVEQAIHFHRPDAVVNLAAYTDVDGAEKEVNEAFEVNAIAPGILARHCQMAQVDFVHISTDYVFDGQSDKPYRVEDPTGPIGVYARSKWEGEEAVRAVFDGDHSSKAKHWIVRAAWIYDSRGKNFMQTMVQLAQRGIPLRVVNDQWGSPTAAEPFADALLELVLKRDQVTSGTWHYGTLGPTTWYEFAKAIFAEMSLEVELSPCTTEEFPTPTARPKFSYLNPHPLARALGRNPILWRDELRQVILKNPS